MKTLGFSNYFFKKLFNLTFVYFTFWTLIIQAFYYIGVLKYFQESVLLLVGTVAFLGFILTYIYPKQITLKPLNYVIKGDKLQIVDLICHQLPFIIFLVMYDKNIKPDSLLFASITILVYIILFNPFKIYDYKYSKDTNNNYTSTYSKNKLRFNIGILMSLIYFVIILLSIHNGVFKN